MRSGFFLLASLGLLAACSEYDIKTDGDVQGIGEDGDQPDIEVTPSSVDFGQVNVVDGIEVTEVITVSNVGLATLKIADITLDVGDSAFTFGSISTPQLPPGSTAEIAVSFLPDTAFEFTDSLLIDSNDPDEPTVAVPLLAEGIAPVIDVSPEEYDFGEPYIGCDKDLPVVITNIGNADLEIDDFEFVSGSNELVFDSNIEGVGVELPWTLAPDAYVTVYVAYVPVDQIEDSSFLYISSNDPFTPRAIAEQTASAAIWGENVDIFEQPLQASTDILFAVDRSCSMDDDIINVQSNFSTFVTTLSELDADYHVAAVVNDDGCIVGDPYIDNTYSAAEAEDAITEMIALGSSYGSNTEREFMLLEAALDEMGSGGCNEDFMREDAKLNLVGVSDEIEQSVNPWSSYVAAFQALKEDPDDVVFHAIGGDVPGGCGSAEPFSGFYEAVVATGGTFLSICATDWGAHLKSLAEGSAAVLDTFTLTETPVEDTIEVYVDGVRTSNGWVYIESSNSVIFADGYVPEGGSTIEIDYALLGVCDE